MQQHCSLGDEFEDQGLCGAEGLGCVQDTIVVAPPYPSSTASQKIPHKFSKHRGSLFPMGCTDTATSDGRRGNNVYEVNTWLWNFGSGKPRLGGLTVEETAVRKKTGRKDLS